MILKNHRWDIGLDLVMNDGVSYDLAVLGPWFASSADKAFAVLRGIRVSDVRIDRDCPAGMMKCGRRAIVNARIAHREHQDQSIVNAKIGIVNARIGIVNSRIGHREHPDRSG
jgi:hypothetical protein